MSLNFDELRHFTGTTQWYRHGLNRTVLFTDGVKYVADNANAYWLIDEIATSQLIPEIAVEEFQVWKLSVKGNQATLSCDDGNRNIVFSKAISFTDFPEPGISFYAEYGDDHRIIMLPSER